MEITKRDVYLHLRTSASSISQIWNSRRPTISRAAFSNGMEDAFFLQIVQVFRREWLHVYTSPWRVLNLNPWLPTCSPCGCDYMSAYRIDLCINSLQLTFSCGGTTHDLAVSPGSNASTTSTGSSTLKCFLRCIWLRSELCPCWELRLVQLGLTALGEPNQAHLKCFNSLWHAGLVLRAPDTQLQIGLLCLFKTAVGVKCVERPFSKQVDRSGKRLSLLLIKPGLDGRFKKHGMCQNKTNEHQRNRNVYTSIKTTSFW